MADVVNVRCDYCGTSFLKEHGLVHSFHLIVDRRMDAAGSMDNDVESLDLCTECLVEIVKTKLFKLLDTYEKRADFCKVVKSELKDEDYVEHVRRMYEKMPQWKKDFLESSFNENRYYYK